MSVAVRPAAAAGGQQVRRTSLFTMLNQHRETVHQKSVVESDEDQAAVGLAGQLGLFAAALQPRQGGAASSPRAGFAVLLNHNRRGIFTHVSRWLSVMGLFAGGSGSRLRRHLLPLFYFALVLSGAPISALTIDWAASGASGSRLLAISSVALPFAVAMLYLMLLRYVREERFENTLALGASMLDRPSVTRFILHTCAHFFIVLAIVAGFSATWAVMGIQENMRPSYANTTEYVVMSRSPVVSSLYFRAWTIAMFQTVGLYVLLLLMTCDVIVCAVDSMAAAVSKAEVHSSDSRAPVERVIADHRRLLALVALAGANLQAMYAVLLPLPTYTLLALFFQRVDSWGKSGSSRTDAWDGFISLMCFTLMLLLMLLPLRVTIRLQRLLDFIRKAQWLDDHDSALYTRLLLYLKFSRSAFRLFGVDVTARFVLRSTALLSGLFSIVVFRLI